MLSAAGSVGRRLLEVQEQLSLTVEENHMLASSVQSMRVALANKPMQSTPGDYWEPMAETIHRYSDREARLSVLEKRFIALLA